MNKFIFLCRRALPFLCLAALASHHPLVHGAPLTINETALEELGFHVNRTAKTNATDPLDSSNNEQMSKRKMIPPLLVENGWDVVSEDTTCDVSSEAATSGGTGSGGCRKRSLNTRGFKTEVQSKYGFWLSIINATPYRFKLFRSESQAFQIAYTEKFARYIEPGQELTIHLEPESIYGDLQVQYLLMGTSKPMWFTLAITDGLASGGPHVMRVKYGGALQTVGNDLELLADLGVMDGTGDASFYLSGREDGFYAADSPYNWMNAMRKDIGNYTLRDIHLTRSHDAGMYMDYKSYGAGQSSNSQTQSANFYTQLTEGGVRVFDFRPLVYKNGDIHAQHGSKVAGGYHGMAGASIDELIDQVNKFNKRFPGELIIIDIDSNEMRQIPGFNRLDGEGIEYLIDRLKAIEHRINFDEGKDITKVKINELIPAGESAVVIRFDRTRLQEAAWPGASNGFVDYEHFPYTKRWSNMEDLSAMIDDQVQHLKEYRKEGNKQPLYASDFVLTAKFFTILVNWPILELNKAVTMALTMWLWPQMHGSFYPNWLALDGIRTPEVRGFALAVNQCFVAKRCGKMNGRVPDAEPLLGHELPSPVDVDLGTSIISYKVDGVTRQLKPELPSMEEMSRQLPVDPDKAWDIVPEFKPNIKTWRGVYEP